MIPDTASSAPDHRPASAAPDFVTGGGEMGALMRAHDWSASPLGPLGQWPQALRTVVRLMLNSRHPMCVFWGADRTCLYNDAYRDSIAPERHPASLGRPAHEAWADRWNVVHPLIERVMDRNGAAWNAVQPVPTMQHGTREDACWTCSYSPIDDALAPGGIGGVLVLCTEPARPALAARRVETEAEELALLFGQAPTFMAVLRGPQHRIESANPAYMRLVGHRPVLGRNVGEALPEAVEQGDLALLDGVFSSGEVFTASGASFSVAATPDGPLVQRFVDFVYQPIRDGAGAVTGIFVHGADVTERVLAESALRESEARFRTALRAGRMGSWETDYASMTRSWSAEGMALFGLSLRDGRGHVGSDDDEFVAALHPDDRHLAPRFRELEDRQDSFPAEYRIVRPDGSRLWLQGRGLVVSRGADGRAKRMVSIMADVTERKQAEERLRIEHERLELALSAGRMGAYDMNLAEGVLWWSAQTYAVFGVSPASFVPTPANVLALLHPDDRETFSRVREAAIAQHQPFMHEFRIVRPDGSQAWLGHRGQAEYDAEGLPIRSFGITMDITERRQAEEMLRDADRNKDRFIAILAHELRNPLAPIRNAIQVLRRKDAVDPTVSWCHDVIDRQVVQMARLLDDLLDASRLSRGQLRLRPEPMDLAAALEQAIEIAKPLIDAQAHAFTFTMPAQPVALQGDLTRLAQVFSNVLINAAKYTPPNGKIALEVGLDESEVVVSVTDNGIGIEPNHIATIFEIFGQVESALSRSQGGQGIGLSLAKGLVEMHGGTIHVSSEGAARGSRFEIRLPLAPRLHAVDPTEVPAPVVPGHARPSILIADDLVDAADSLALALRALGHVVDIAYDGEQAVRLAAEKRPEVVLMDLGMPKVDGYEACRQIRAAPWGAHMTLVAQTGWGSDHDRRRTREAGFDHHVVKPIELSALVALFER